MANSVDPDQMPLSAASDLGLHSFQRPIWVYTVFKGLSVSILRVITVADQAVNTAGKMSNSRLYKYR